MSIMLILRPSLLISLSKVDGSLVLLLVLMWISLVGLGAFGFYLLSQRLRQLDQAEKLGVDIGLLSARLFSQAIGDFKTDLIPEVELIPYIRFRYLDFCSSYGVDPSYEEQVIKEVLGLARLHIVGLEHEALEGVSVQADFLYEGSR